MISCELIIIGREILQGVVHDTNAHWLCKELLKLGIRVNRIYVVDDVKEEIKEILGLVIKRKPKVVITTGGLGPTYDDITVESVSEALNMELVEDPRALEIVMEACKRGNLELTKERRKMAIIPKGSIALHNQIGTAPGIYINYNDIHIFLLPGVPAEMKNIFENEVKKYLLKIEGREYYFEFYLKIFGIAESDIAPILKIYRERYFPVYFKSHPKGLGEEAKHILLHVWYLTNNSENLKIMKEIKENLLQDLSKIAYKIEEL
jgi:Predicted nucleotide-utilizing enzyme related to molybdopterin-biosynthesis enzyme MoeA